MRRYVPGSALGLVVSALCALAASAAGPNQATDWRSTNYDESANRYSPLDQITRGNVAQLQQAWSFHLKPAGYTGRPREDEAIPLVIGNTMYLASPYGAIHALDATTGTEKWKFTLPNGDLPAKRGIAYWPGADGVPPSIIFGGLRGRALLDQGVGRHAQRRLRRQGCRQPEDARGDADRAWTWPTRCCRLRPSTRT